MTFRYTDLDGDEITARPAIGVPYVAIATGLNGCFIPLDRVEELIAGIRDAARQAAAQTTVEQSAATSPLDDVLRIVSDVVTEANDCGGVDLNDLATRLEQAGHPLPDDE